MDFRRQDGGQGQELTSRGVYGLLALGLLNYMPERRMSYLMRAGTVGAKGILQRDGTPVGVTLFAGAPYPTAPPRQMQRETIAFYWATA